MLQNIRGNENRINTLEPGVKDHYHKLMEENTFFRKEFDQLMGQLDNINEKIHGYEDELARDKIRDEYSAMEKQVSVGFIYNILIYIN